MWAHSVTFFLKCPVNLIPEPETISGMVIGDDDGGKFRNICERTYKYFRYDDGMMMVEV